MAMSFPYSFFSCPCTDGATSATIPGASEEQADEEEEEKTFNPKSQRTNFSLYPLDHLMWCEDCHDIKCSRCTVEEIVCWYCPSCLFEVPSSTVKSEGNRCTRNCFDCPSCTAPMAVNSLDTESGGIAGPWILACDYCNWTTLDIGVKFERPTNIYGQLAKMQQAPSKPKTTSDGQHASMVDAPSDPDARFAALKTFYSSQLSKTATANPLMSPSGEVNYNSPSSLARIMSLYTGLGSYGKKTAGKSSIMRESADPIEGLQVVDRASEDAMVEKLRVSGWAGTASTTQRREQIHPVRFVDELRAIPTLLRTKRSKRCRACRHILVKPEAKVQSTRYRIKLVAINYVPSLILKPLQASSSTPLNLSSLPSSKALQFLLTLKNPIFDPMKVTLATPTQTPGRFSSKVTILCPQFEIGANTDVWDEALSEKNGKKGSKTDRSKSGSAESEGKVAEAGKIWDKGHNWTTVVVEIVCARIEAKDDEIEEDEDVLEIPMFVRIEYEADAAGDEAGGATPEKERREKRELAYWSVLGVGKIAHP